MTGRERGREGGGRERENIRENEGGRSKDTKPYSLLLMAMQEIHPTIR